MTVSTPATPVVVAAERAREVAAAVGAALANVAAHAGPDARAWVLLEHDADELVVSVRDDGRGIAPDRLAAARAEGRLGVASSIEGRVRDLGGTMTVESAPGAGTEVELRVPVGEDDVTRVMVVDDHPMWREAVARDLAEAGHDVVATAGDGGEAVRRAPAARPEVVVLDLQLPVMSGVEVDPGAGRRRPDGAGAGAVGQRRAGRRARGGQGRRHRLPGEVGVPRGAARRRRAHRAGGGRCSPRAWPAWCWGSTGGCRRAGRPSGPPAPQLTERETEVLRLVAKGLSYKEIAERLVLSHRTVQNHVQNTLNKLQLHNRVELVRYAIEQGLDDELS